MTLTKTDLKNIQLIVRQQVKEEVSEQLDDKIGKLPTKDEFFSKMDKWMRVMTDKPAEKAAHKNRHDRTDKRLEKIEKHLGITAY